MTDTAEKKPAAKRDVDYTIDTLDELPEHASPLVRGVIERQLDQVIADHETLDPKYVNDDGTGKWRRIALYRVSTAAAAAANVLRRKHGDSERHEGFTFRTAKVDVGAGVTKTGLFVRYNPDAILAGEAEKHFARVAKETAEKDNGGASKAPKASAAS